MWEYLRVLRNNKEVEEKEGEVPKVDPLARYKDIYDLVRSLYKGTLSPSDFCRGKTYYYARLGYAIELKKGNVTFTVVLKGWRVWIFCKYFEETCEGLSPLVYIELGDYARVNVASIHSDPRTEAVLGMAVDCIKEESAYIQERLDQQKLMEELKKENIAKKEERKMNGLLDKILEEKINL